MLVLSRKRGQKILIGERITVTVERAHGVVKLGVDAPSDVMITRPERKPKAERQNGRRKKWQP